jgi:4-aminobutyrate aminotransferase-like enzyme
MACAAKQLELFDNGVLENGRNMGKYLGDGLKKLQEQYPQIGDIRQVGMHIGVEFADEKLNPLTDEATKIRTVGFKNGLILGTGGVRKNVLKVKPPMVINQAECDEVLEKFEASVKEVLG